MSLNKKQKEQLKALVKFKSLDEAVKILKIDLNEAKKYLIDLWGEEKYRKIIKKNQNQKESIFHQNFNFKLWVRQNLKYFVFLTILVIINYANSLPNDFLSDDIATIVQNPQINRFDYFLGKNFFPFYFNPRNFCYFFINKVFGLNPLFFRLLNILSHLGNVYLVFLLTNFFFNFPVSFFIAGFFAVHPILVEAVTWISGGPYTNAAFFLFLSLFFWIVWKKDQKNLYYLFSVISFLIALLFSERVIWFLAVLFFYEICQGSFKKNIKFFLPFLLLVIWWSAYLLGLTGKRIAALETNYYMEPGFDNPFVKIPIAVTSYLELIFWPNKLSFYHSELNFTPLQFFFKSVGLLSFFGLTAYFLIKDRRIAFWLMFFFLSLTPTLTPLRISWVVAERYAYTGSLGIFVVLAFLLQKIGEKTKNQKISWIIWGVLILALSIRTIVRNFDWRNQDTLWLATAKTSPSSPQNHNNLGDLYGRRGDLEKAVEEFKKAIKLKPNYADAYHNLANTYYQMGKFDLAEENYQRALEFNPHLWQSYLNLGALYFAENKLDKAEGSLLQAIKINPQNPDLHFSLGYVYFQEKKFDEAKKALNASLSLDPNHQKAKELLSKINLTP